MTTGPVARAEKAEKRLREVQQALAVAERFIPLERVKEYTIALREIYEADK